MDSYAPFSIKFNFSQHSSRPSLQHAHLFSLRNRFFSDETESDSSMNTVTP